MRSCYGWVCRFCRWSINTIHVHTFIMVGFAIVVISRLRQYAVILWLGLSVLLSVSKHNMWSYYGLVCCCRRPPVNTRCGRIMVEFFVVVSHVVLIRLTLSWLSSVSKLNMWSYYDWVYCLCRSSVNQICGRIMVGFVVVVVC